MVHIIKNRHSEYPYIKYNIMTEDGRPKFVQLSSIKYDDDDEEDVNEDNFMV